MVLVYGMSVLQCVLMHDQKQLAYGNTDQLLRTKGNSNVVGVESFIYRWSSHTQLPM